LERCQVYYFVQVCYCSIVLWLYKPSSFHNTQYYLLTTGVMLLHISIICLGRLPLVVYIRGLISVFHNLNTNTRKTLPGAHSGCFFSKLFQLKIFIAIAEKYIMSATDHPSSCIMKICHIIYDCGEKKARCI